MNAIWPGPIFQDPDDSGSDPKAGGLDETGTDEDDQTEASS